jgi:hypothetical protein
MLDCVVKPRLNFDCVNEDIDIYIFYVKELNIIGIDIFIKMSRALRGLDSYSVKNQINKIVERLNININNSI